MCPVRDPFCRRRAKDPKKLREDWVTAYGEMGVRGIAGEGDRGED